MHFSPGAEQCATRSRLSAWSWSEDPVPSPAPPLAYRLPQGLAAMQTRSPHHACLSSPFTTGDATSQKGGGHGVRNFFTLHHDYKVRRNKG